MRTISLSAALVVAGSASAARADVAILQGYYENSAHVGYGSLVSGSHAIDLPADGSPSPAWKAFPGTTPADASFDFAGPLVLDEPAFPGFTGVAQGRLKVDVEGTPSNVTRISASYGVPGSTDADPLSNVVVGVPNSADANAFVSGGRYARIGGASHLDYPGMTRFLFEVSAPTSLSYSVRLFGANAGLDVNTVELTRPLAADPADVVVFSFTEATTGTATSIQPVTLPAGVYELAYVSDTFAEAIGTGAVARSVPAGLELSLNFDASPAAVPEPMAVTGGLVLSAFAALRRRPGGV